MRYGDLVELEINLLMAETEKEIPKIPADLDRNYESAGRWAGFTAGAAIGGKVGAGLGIAGGPLGAIAGTIPGLVIGASSATLVAQRSESVFLKNIRSYWGIPLLGSLEGELCFGKNTVETQLLPCESCTFEKVYRTD